MKVGDIMSKIDLIEFTDKKDSYELMYKWCSQEFIYEWFEQRKLSYEEIENKYKNKLLANQQQLFFINYNDNKIGFVQIYKYDDKKSESFKKYDSIYEYDIFIGESEYLSRGIGTQIIKYVNNYIYEKYLCDCIVLRPFKRNERAVKCYEKCGFEIVDEYVGSDTLGNKEKMIVLLNKPDRWTFGIDVDRLVNLVLDGKKTATTSLYELDNVSKVGDISILTDLKDNNVCFIKTINVIITEFKNITWDLAKLEGEDKSLNEWKENHMNFFKKIDPNFNENTKVIFEVFEVIKKCK